MVGNDLLAEVEHLRAELEAVSQELEIERAHRNVLHRAVLRLRSIEDDDSSDADNAILSLDGGSASYQNSPTDGGSSNTANRTANNTANRTANNTAENAQNVYVFDDEDESRDAFDEFFATPDPHLEKVRGFLLD